MSTRQQVGLYFALFFAFLVLGGREPPWNDARQIYQVAESLVERGAVNVEARTFVVRDGKYYAAHPFLSSAVHLPGAVLMQAITKGKASPDADKLLLPLASHIGPAALAALIGLLFFRLCLSLGSSLAAARVGTATLAFGTMIAVYARSPYSEITQAAAYLLFFGVLYAYVEQPTRRRALHVGLCAAVLVNVKVIFLLTLPGAAVLAGRRLWRARTARSEVLRQVGLAVAGGLPGVVLLFAYNYARSRSFLATGYPADQLQAGAREFGEWTAVGLWGLFFSLGKSVFLYSPPLIAAALALPHALRTRSRLWLVVLLATAGPVLLFYGRFTFWHGDWCWGPRYSLFALPVALLPLVFAYDDLRLSRRRLANVAAAGIFALGVVVQVLGGLFYWDHYIRVAREAQKQWLGRADRSGATTPDTGEDCGPCIEDVYGLNYLPAFQPIEGHWWLLRNRARGRDWQQAEADAPWHRYTTLKLNVAASYGRARYDWWLMDWRSRWPVLGGSLFAVFLLGSVAGGVLALRQPRGKSDRAPRFRGRLAALSRG
jgi:hypothetical protein